MSAAAPSTTPVLPVVGPAAKRLRCKTNVQDACAAPVLEDEPGDAHRQVYLVTAPHPLQARSADGRLLTSPDSMTREAMCVALRDAAAHPMPAGQWQRMHPQSAPQPAEVVMMVVFREYHAAPRGGAAHTHFHVAVLFATTVRFAPLKRALLWNHGIATHWSCRHDGYWSAVRYGRVPTPRKLPGALDPAPWTWAAAGAHTPLDDCVHEPTTAKALGARRMLLEHTASARGKPVPRVREVDVWPVVVAAGVRIQGSGMHAEYRLMQYAKAHCSDAMVAFLFKHRSRLTQLIRAAWEWEDVDTALAVADSSRMQLLQAAVGKPCVCGGDWLHHVQVSLCANGINAPELCHYTLHALERGRHESVKALALLGRHGGEGKSMFLRPLDVLFGEEYVQRCPQPGRFPLLGIDTKKIALLDEWHFDTDILPMPLQLLWLEGKPVPVTLPQNVAGQSGHLVYTGDAPIFITAPEDAMQDIMRGSMAAPTGECSMLLRRLKLFHFAVPIPPPQRDFAPCPRCFAMFVTGKAQEWRAAHGQP
jgi:hypothetical protein